MEMRRFIFLIVVLAICIPSPGFCTAEVVKPMVRETELHVNTTDISNITVPPEYQAGQAPVRIEVTLPATLMPGPKGEMQAGPRSIGFDFTPLVMAFSILMFAAVAVMVWFLHMQSPAEEPVEGIGNSHERED